VVVYSGISRTETVPPSIRPQPGNPGGAKEKAFPLMLNVGPAPPMLSESHPTIASIAEQNIATYICLPSIFNLSHLELRPSLFEARWEAPQRVASLR
jgi:hypothetical protein